MDRGKQLLIENNMDLVYYTLRKMNVTIEDDVVSEGMLALVRAAKNFDDTKGIQFSTFAISYIKGCVKTYLNFKVPLIKPSRYSDNLNSILKREDTEAEFNAIEAPDEHIESKLIVDDFLSKLTERERKVIIGLMEEKTQSEISKDVNVCQAQISKIVRIVRYKYMIYNRSNIKD